MINIRYHIISLVAVFLALGIGLALGSSFIDSVVVRALRTNVNSLGDQKDALEDDNGRLERVLDAVDELEEEAGPQLFGGHLDGVPVFVIAVRGVNEEAIERAETAISRSGAEFGGTMWLTDRLVLDDEPERQDLARILGLEDGGEADAAALRDALVLRVGNVISDAIRPRDPLAPDPEETTTTAASEEPTTSVAEEQFVAEPEVIANLRAAGFVEYENAAGEPDDGGMRLPVAGSRLVVVSGPGAVVPDDQVVVPLLRMLAASGPAAVVAAQSVASDAPVGQEPSRIGFVGAIREDDDLRSSISTVDDLELPVGRFVLVLTLEQSGAGVVGHYGMGSGADQVAPAPPEGG